MSQKKRGTIAIVGGGIGGLNAALWLISNGWDVTIFEKGSNVDEPGAGIQITPNASRGLLKMGLGPTLNRYGVKPAFQQFRMFDSGEVEKETPINAEHDGAPYYQIYRPHLKQGLLARVNELAAEMGLKHPVVHVNHEVVGFEENDSEVRLLFKDSAIQSKFDGRNESHFDLLIGADGLHSAIRKQIIHDDKPHYTGQIAWRVVVDTAKLQPAPESERLGNVMSVFMKPSSHVVCYYLDQGKLLNFVGVLERTHPATDGERKEGWKGKHNVEEFRRDFAGAHPALQHIINAPGFVSCNFQELYDREPIPNYVSPKGRVVLLGDAAHPIPPYLAQGAATALRGGIVLARALDAVKPIPEATKIYENTQVPFAERMLFASRQSGQHMHPKSREEILERFRKSNAAVDRAWIYQDDPEHISLIKTGYMRRPAMGDGTGQQL